MIKTITQSDFTTEFHRCGRGNQFSHKALLALYDFLEELYDDKYELDVIGLCCDFTEYDDLDDLLEACPYCDTLKDVEHETLVIQVDGGSYIIQNF